MSWSTSFSGSFCVFADSTHNRVPLVMDFPYAGEGGEEGENMVIMKIERLIELGMRHVVIKMQRSVKTNYAKKFEILLMRLRVHGVSPFLSITVVSLEYELPFLNQFIDCNKELINLFIFDMTEIVKESDRFKIVEIYDTLHQSLLISSPSISLGIAGVTDTSILQYLLLPESNVSCILTTESLICPMLNLREVDFIHRRKCNVMAFMCSEGIMNLASHTFFGKPVMLEKYSQTHAAAIFTKCMLELGIIVGVNVELVEEDFIVRHFIQLCHPFVSRRDFVSPTTCRRFCIMPEDLLVVKEFSEEIEELDDEKIFQSTLNTLPKRVLSDSR